MKPPDTISVLNQHGGFTAETPCGRKVPARRSSTGKDYQPTNSLWRPGHILKRGTVGALIDFDEKSFYQTNNDATRARYKVSGYRYPVLVWFDNATGQRIA